MWPTWIPLLIKADIIWASTDPDDRQHLLGAVPTGYGKSLPMLVAALLLPPGEPASCWQICLNDALLILTTTVDTFSTGSTTIIIPPLTVIERQLQEDCLKYGIEVLVGSQVGSEFRASSKPLHHLQLCVKLCHVYWWPLDCQVSWRIWLCWSKLLPVLFLRFPNPLAFGSLFWPWPWHWRVQNCDCRGIFLFLLITYSQLLILIHHNIINATQGNSGQLVQYSYYRIQLTQQTSKQCK